MAILPIIKYPNPILRERSKEVKEINSEIRELINNMRETMYDAPGIGLAAPQVGILQRICIVDIGRNEETGHESPKYALINPEIIEKDGSIKHEEGCLSIPGIHEVVQRPSVIRVKALDEKGEKIEFQAEGLLAICIQHEIDHLDGILFFDRITGLKSKLLQKKLKKLFPSTK